MGVIVTDSMSLGINTSMFLRMIAQSYGTMSMAYRVYLSDYLPLDISTTAAYLSIGANQFALNVLKLLI